MTREVVAAGGVLWRTTAAGTVEVCLVHRPRYDDWSLPKGKLDEGEHPLTCAVREVVEETGFTAAAGPALGVSRYRVLDRGRDVAKRVQWWAMRAGEGRFEPSNEVDELAWLPVPDALGRLTTGQDAGPLEAFARLPAELAVVVLLRHGSAGDREDWPGPDDERPLDPRGRAQATAGCEVLAALSPQRLLAAPPLRCVQTVLPLAQRVGRPVELDADLAEANPGRLAPAVLELARPGAAAVLCSQGGVIPSALQHLSRGAVAHPPSAKGSAWVLTLAEGRLLQADYLADLTSPTLPEVVSLAGRR